MKRFFSYFGMMLFSISFLLAQTQTEVKPNRTAIIENIENNSKVIIHQDPKLDKLINDYLNKPEVVEEEQGPYVGPGYRLQVFSSNAQKNAKNEAFSIERKLRSTFPDYGVYRIYASPFWKVRIGDFKTAGEARKFRTELVKAFPELSRETYTVRESKVTIR
ncbi:MAG: SPOR domain-containing protein [Paludibacteraceae bacterium]